MDLESITIEQMHLDHRAQAKVLTACWEKDCYVVIKPQGNKRNPEVKLLLSMQGTNKLGEMVFKQDDTMVKKINEMYLFMLKKVVI